MCCFLLPKALPDRLWPRPLPFVPKTENSRTAESGYSINFFKHLIMRLITKEIEKKFQKHPFRSQDKKESTLRCWSNISLRGVRRHGS